MLHMAEAWPVSIVPLHPSEYVVVRGAIAEMVLFPAFVTYMFPLLGLNAMPNGAEPTGMVDMTVFVEGFITDTESLLKFVTYMFPLLGLNAMPNGAESAGSGTVSLTNPSCGLFSVT